MIFNFDIQQMLAKMLKIFLSRSEFYVELMKSVSAKRDEG